MNKQTQTILEWLGTGSVNLFGRPFSGKDTQGEILAEALGAPLIGGGDILRNHHDPARIEKIMSSGGLIPSDYFFDMVLPYLSRTEFKGKPLVLDALGRSSGEEETILKATEHSGHPLKAVLLLNVPEEEVWRRFEAAKAVHDRDGRSDDKVQVLQTRLQKFKEKTLPVLEFYRRKGLLIEVNGAQSRDAVEKETLAKLAQKAAS